MMFSSQLSRLRKEMKMTQEYLAERCDVSRQAVAKWESGESLPSIYKLIEIANLFNVSLDELVLGGTSSNDKKEIARKIYNLYVENMEHLRTYMLRNSYSPGENLATDLRVAIKKSRIVFSKEIVDELLEMTHDFGQPREYVLGKYQEVLKNSPNISRRYCEVLIPKMYDRIEEILGEYLELQ